MRANQTHLGGLFVRLTDAPSKFHAIPQNAAAKQVSHAQQALDKSFTTILSAQRNWSEVCWMKKLSFIGPWRKAQL